MNLLPKNFLIDVEDFSGKLLNKKSELSIILEACNNDQKIEDFENLSFTGKYVNGLFSVLKNSVKIPEIENVDHIKKDLSENMEKVISQLKEITFNMDEKHKKFFEENYFQLSQSSIQNLQKLVEDLDIIKKYLNYLKRK
jgi:succinate dehydrogenase/fumarate reductase-like Fe-S protein